MKCSVILLSYNRLPYLLALLDVLRTQDYPDFEVIVIEQSTTRPPDLVERLEVICREDPRICVHRFPPLGVGGARNVGLELATGEVVLIQDDDDLPASSDWISRHMRNYKDPDCIGVGGGWSSPDGKGGGLVRRFPRLGHRWLGSYTMFGTPRGMWQLRRRKKGIQWLSGGNSSIRRRWALDVGGWYDECTNGHEEHDFYYQLRKRMRPEHYLVFDPEALHIRRLDIPGGAERRTGRIVVEVEGHVRYYLGIIARQRPWRTALLLPFYPGVIFIRTLDWVIDSRRHEPWWGRLLAIADLLVRYPFFFAIGVFRLGRPSKTTTANRERDLRQV